MIKYVDDNERLASYRTNCSADNAVHASLTDSVDIHQS